MEETQHLASSNGQLPRFVEADPSSIYMTPNEMRAIRQATGKPLTDMEAEDAAQATVWIVLRRQGYQAAYDEVGDVGLKSVETLSDPTPTATSAASPPSAVSGG